MLSITMLNIYILSVNFMNVVILSLVILSVYMLNVGILSVVLLNVFMPRVVTPYVGASVTQKKVRVTLSPVRMRALVDLAAVISPALKISFFRPSIRKFLAPPIRERADSQCHKTFFIIFKKDKSALHCLLI